MRRTLARLLAMLVLSGCHHQTSSLEQMSNDWVESARAVVEASDRTEADRRLDPGRHPAELLAFFGVRPGMRVAELGAGTGYTTELLARAVRPNGTVYGQNSPFILQRFAQSPWSDRLARPPMRGVVRLDRPFDDPFPPDVRDLDQVWINLFYHDTVWMQVDRAKMNRAVFDALKRGGVYIVADHSAKPGAGVDVAKTLHRIEESLVRREVEAAGFRLAASGDFLRNPDDPREVPVFKNPVRNDEFVLKFVKP